MKRIKVLGSDYEVIEGSSNEDRVDFHDGKVYVHSHQIPSDRLLKEALSDCLYIELMSIYERIKKENRVGVMGNLRFEVSEKIDNKKLRIAKLAGNRIIVKMNAVSLPKEALKYLIVHEVAHLVTTKHNEKFWKVVESIYPDYVSGKNLFESHEEHLKESGLEF